jgi:hypothetical protein
MTNMLLINGAVASPSVPAPPSPAFFVNVFDSKTEDWMGIVPAPSAGAIPLSLLSLNVNQRYK